MKTLIISLGLIVSSLAHADCADVSGTYALGKDGSGRENVQVVRQTGCETIAIGGFQYNYQAGHVENMSAPIIVYVSEGAQDECPHSFCAPFTATASKVTFNLPGYKETEDGLKCHYNRIEWRPAADALNIRYYLDDARPECQQIGVLRKSLSRFAP